MSRRLWPVLILLLAIPSPAFAWGAAAHRFMMNRAIELLPAELKPFFDRYRDELVLRVNDPDLWRAAGWEDDPNHFVNFGVREYGAYPFVELPREYGAAVEKFGMAALRKNGLLPWREQEEFGNLRRAFAALARGGAFARTDVVLFAAAAAHYIQDAHQPLHATNNHDGQMTGQSGVHARFETALFERAASKLTIAPVPTKPITNPRDAAFDTLLASHQLVSVVLDADKAAVVKKGTYDDEYFNRFLERVKPVLERRIADAISATAALIVGAWQQAGAPPPGVDMPRVPQKVRER